MTNAEKYKEVFGFEPERRLDCICSDCTKCPIDANCCDKYLVFDWWNSEYKEKADENS